MLYIINFMTIMETYGCGLNVNKQLMEEKCGIVCCLTKLPLHLIGKDLQKVLVTNSHIWWYTDLGWKLTGFYNSVTSPKSIAVDFENNMSVSENRTVIWKEDKIFIWDADHWRICPVQSNAVIDPMQTFVSDSETIVCGSTEDSPKFSHVCIEDNSLLALDNKGNVYSSGIPLPFGCGIHVTQVAVGKEHFMALTCDSQVYTWGSGMRGQLGHGIIHKLDDPTCVEILLGIVVTKVICGGWHCIALSDAGDVYVWGWNESGQLGFKSSQGGDLLGEFEHVCCCDKSPAVSLPVVSKDWVECGQELVNPFYNSDTVNVLASPKLLNFWREDVTISNVLCGNRHTIFCLENGTVWASGMNRYGQLGFGHTRAVQEPTLLPIQHVISVWTGGWTTIVARNAVVF